MEAQSFRRENGENDPEQQVGTDLFADASRDKSRAPGEPHKMHLPPASYLRLALSRWVLSCALPALFPRQQWLWQLRVWDPEIGRL